MLIRFSGVWFSALTNCKRVLQTMEYPLQGIRGSAPVSTQVGRGIVVDDTPALESFAEGYEHAQR